MSCTLSSVAHKSLLTIIMCTPIHAVQRRAIVTVLNAYCQDLYVTSLASDLVGMGALTVEQYQKLMSLNDKKRTHKALLYTLLASDGPDIFHKLVKCIGLSDASTASNLQGVMAYQVM